jgi:hypothetical protein
VRPNPFILFAVLILPIFLYYVCTYALFYVIFRPLLADLYTLHRDDQKVVRWRRLLELRVATLLLASAVGAIVAWFMLRFYQERIDALPVVPGAIKYYDDISLLLVGLLFCAPPLLVPFLGLKKVIRRTGLQLIVTYIALLSIAALALSSFIVWNYINPTAKVIITRDALSCDRNGSVSWSNVADLDLATGRYGERYAELYFRFKPAPVDRSIFSAKPLSAMRCEVTGLSADYQTVYQAIWTAWQANMSAHTPSPRLH